ncbi:phage tail protein [Chromobacterium sp. IIBBL 290-4]|uniref:phage tail protein n=1 Tax=Chromobacterium sp. IIBBL 290-4 TaxID=2953890 RepID=UPI0020B839BC|nr:phage tail protein [Chromobacterium sp. IIBBL 290-4]UTH73987.1 phage tail protein [Chromobacterium sp. IIBBL 290-4]
MFALLGEVQFDLITYFDGFESQFGADYAEHALIEGKPRLQWIADKLDEIRIQLSFHSQYCDPEAELLKLRQALANHQAMALVLGNGDYKGWFVLTDVTATSKQTDKAGTLIALEASITLREYVGDKKKPPAPAVQPKQAPLAAISQPAGGALNAAANSMREQVSKMAAHASQAQAAIRVAGDAAALAKQMGSPQAMLGRVPGLLSQLKDAAGPLQKLSSMSGLPEMAGIARSASEALGVVDSAKNALSGASAGNILGQLERASAYLGAAGGALNAAAPAVSKLASRAITRAI